MAPPSTTAGQTRPRAGPSSALAAKLRAARPGTRDLAKTEEQALRLAAARAGRRCLDCDLMVLGTQTAHVDGPGDLMDALSGQALMASLVSAEGDQGVLALDAAVVAAVTALRTTGGLGKLAPTDPGGDDPPATAIQAALVRPLITALLLGWHAALGGKTGRSDHRSTSGLIAGYRVGTQAMGARSLLMGLPNGPLVSLRLEVEFAGRVAGRIFMAFPIDRLAQAQTSADDADRAAAEAVQWTGALRRQVLNSPARVRAVLHRADLPLDAVKAWQVGSLLPIPATALDHVTLDPRSADAPLIGRLGQMRGARAVRLKGRAADLPDPALTSTGQVAGFADGLGADPPMAGAESMPTPNDGGAQSALDAVP